MTALDQLAREAEAAAAPVVAVETIDVAAVNAKEHRSLYQKQVTIHPKRAQGLFRRIKWIVMAVTLAIYYMAPWIRWDRGAGAPDQAILVDFPARRFYFFFIEIWPQEVYYFTGLLILAALALFLFTALAGRVWCGYTCPQTVWTDLFVAVERWVEGDRNARIKLDRAPLTAGKIGKRLSKHAIWLVIAVLTGGAWVFYFADAPTLAIELARFEAPSTAYYFIGLFTFTTYTLGGWSREQVCTYMCPWPRIQGAMMDEDSYLVTYREQRGEPRSAHKRDQSWEGRGHCIDCNLCVAVCPMGIDIRQGPQLECITCALCIDACDSVMAKVGLPPGLIAYDTYRNMQAQTDGTAAPTKLIRPRTIIYSGLIAVVSAIMLFVLLTRADLEMNVLRDRNPLFVTLSDGSIRNGYTIKLLNKLHEVRTLSLTADGLPGLTLTAVGQQDGEAPEFTVKPDSLRSVKIYVIAPRAGLTGASVPLFLQLADSTGTVLRHETIFRGPE